MLASMPEDEEFTDRGVCVATDHRSHLATRASETRSRQLVYIHTMYMGYIKKGVRRFNVVGRLSSLRITARQRTRNHGKDRTKPPKKSSRNCTRGVVRSDLSGNLARVP